MQTLNSKPKKKRNRFVGAKYVLTSISLISTIGLWQFFSNKDSLTEFLPSDFETELNNNIQFQAMPTLVPLSPGNVTNSGNVSSIVNNSGLREVTAPTLQPQSQPRIAIQQVIINNPVNNSNGGTITRTGSSR
jgi:hypothetical protein